MIFTSRSLRARGLKSWKVDPRQVVFLSRSLRARGLKFIMDDLAGQFDDGRALYGRVD